VPDDGPYFGSVDNQAVTATSQIPVSEATRAAIEEWWQIGYGNSDPRPDLDDEGYEAFTRDLASRLRSELGPDWIVTSEL
jgi:hypothetical protein